MPVGATGTVLSPSESTELWQDGGVTRLVLTAGASILLLVLCACSFRELRKLDEAVLHQGSKYELKLVRHWQNIFLHYNGEVYSIQCRSEGTRNHPAKKRQEEGWRVLEQGGAIGSESAEQLAKDLLDKFLFVDDSTFVKINGGVSVTFDACATMRGWFPTSLPLEFIDEIEKPDYCAPKGGADCRHYDFLGDRSPVYEDIQAEASGTISFVARSPAFKDGAAFLVESRDSGESWDATRLQPAPLD